MVNIKLRPGLPKMPLEVLSLTVNCKVHFTDVTLSLGTDEIENTFNNIIPATKRIIWSA